MVLSEVYCWGQHSWEENKWVCGINFEAIKSLEGIWEQEQKIRRIRSQKDTTVVELANALGVNEAAIRNYEIGYRQASRDKLETDCPKARVCQ